MIAYHVTRLTDLDSILRVGLEPGVPADCTDERAVFLFPTKADFETAMGSWLDSRFDENDELVLLTVDVTGLRFAQPVAWEIAVFETILPHRIKRRVAV